MATTSTYIKGDEASKTYRNLLRYLQMLRESVDGLADVREVIIRMRESDGTSTTHYNLVASECGYEATLIENESQTPTAQAAAKASFEELDALLAKLNTDNAVSVVRTAIDQACAKHGV